MLLCDLSKSMQLLCRLIMQSSLLTLVVQYGTELAEVPESRTLIFVGSLFGPVSHNTTPAFGDVRGFPVGRGYWVKRRTRTCSSPQGWKHPWNNRTLRTVYEKSWQNNAKASVLVPDFNKILVLNSIRKADWSAMKSCSDLNKWNKCTKVEDCRSVTKSRQEIFKKSEADTHYYQQGLLCWK